MTMPPCALKVLEELDRWEGERRRMARQVTLNPIFAIRISRELTAEGNSFADNLEAAILETGYPRPDMTIYMTPLATNWRVPFGEVEVR